MCNSKKKCSKCGEEKDLCEFHNDKSKSDGKRSECKSCILDQIRKVNNTDPKKYRISQKERKELFEKGLKRCGFCKEEKDLCEFNNNKRNKDGKRNECKSCVLDFNRKIKNIDPKKHRLSKKQIQKLDRQKIQRCSCCKEIKPFDDFVSSSKKINGKYSICRSCQNKRSNERRKNDPLFRLYKMISSRIYHSLKEKGYTKDSKTQKILGCSFEDFKKHIEDQFEPWMNWENHGKRIISERNVSWDLDHIIPISSATTEEEVIKLNHYTNFQPLCSYINQYIKRDRLDFSKTELEQNQLNVCGYNKTTLLPNS